MDFLGSVGAEVLAGLVVAALLAGAALVRNSPKRGGSNESSGSERVTTIGS